MGFVIHWHESAMDLHVFPIPIPTPTSLSTRSLWVFPVHQAWALVSCIQPGLVICFSSFRRGHANLLCIVPILVYVLPKRALILAFWMLSFKPTFSLSSFTFKRLFSSSSLSAIRVVSSAYLRLLIFLPAILIPACASSSPAFHLMYSAYKFNKQSDNIPPWRTPFPIWNQSVVSWLVLTVASWPAHTDFSGGR